MSVLFGSGLVGFDPGVRITLSAQTIPVIGTDGVSSTSGIKFRTDGSLQITNTGGIYVTVVGEYLLPTINAADFEIQATLVSGTLTAGTTGSYLALTSEREFEVTNDAVGNYGAELSITVRRIGSTYSVTRTITLDLIIEP